MIEALLKQCARLSRDGIMGKTRFSRSQLYRWREGKQLERKERAGKVLPEATVENAAALITAFPHLSGRKGQAYMLYHNQGLIGEKAYDVIKRHVKRLLAEEVSRRELFEEKGFYAHIRPDAPGEIWAEDFTDLVVEGWTFKLAVLLDVFDNLYLGAAVQRRATARLVGRPVDQALESTGGRGPTKFLLSDNGTEYICEEHQRLLTSAEIVGRRIPACVPQYNGSAESGMRQFKSVFYNIWEYRTRKQTDEGKNLLERVRAAVVHTVRLMNEVIPRPCLDGVTPADVHHGRGEEKRKEIQEYREKEEARQDVPAWKRSYREVLKSGILADEMSNGELLTKVSFFYRKPLRRIAQRNRKGVG